MANQDKATRMMKAAAATALAAYGFKRGGLVGTAIGIVGAGCEVVSRHPIRPKQREVLDLIGEFGLLAIDAIGEAQGPVVPTGNAIAEGERLARGGATVAFFARQFAHAGVEKPGALRGGLVFIALMGRGEVAIGKALGKDGLRLPAVQREAFGLFVLFVPGESQPAQPLEYGLDAGLGVALHVGIVEAQHHGSMVVAGIKPIKYERAGAADVQKTGGRWREADARNSSL